MARRSPFLAVASSTGDQPVPTPNRVAYDPVVAGPADRARGDEEPLLAEHERGYPAPGEVLRRLRTQRGWSLRDVAERSGLSASFLGAVERGESDIALERLARLAAIFDHDVGSFL